MTHAGVVWRPMLRIRMLTQRKHRMVNVARLVSVVNAGGRSRLRRRGRLPGCQACDTLFAVLSPVFRPTPMTADLQTAHPFVNGLPEGVRRKVLEEVRRLAREAGAAAYLVGGPVRDCLLGVPFSDVNDLDITVVGDAPALASRLADAIAGWLTVHRRFGTASVATANLTVDLVTARRETYRQPGALPDVAAGSLADDLARRDFTINAMAMSIDDNDAGLIDPHGGQRDLDAGVIRILHPQSFGDDPTRILRAARYASRFGFRIDDDTLAELRAARDAGAMSTLTGDRVRHELERILQEPSPADALLGAEQLGALAAAHPALTAAHLRPLRDRAASPLTWLAALVWPLRAEAGAAVGARLNAPSDWARVIDDTAILAARLPQLAERELAPSAVCALLDGLAPDALRGATMLATPAATERVCRYLCEWWSVAPRLRGSDLLELGVPAGPAVGAALRALRQARLDGVTGSREDEERLARSRFCGNDEASETTSILC